MTSPAPLRREVRVTASAEHAFTLFTDHIGEWWPIDSLSVHRGRVAFEGSLLVERTEDGSSVWAEVTEWDPPASLGLAWHAGTDDPSRATDVRVTFTQDGAETLVSLVHSGWEKLKDPFESAAEYGHGWPIVLGWFADLVSAGASNG